MKSAQIISKILTNNAGYEAKLHTNQIKLSQDTLNL